jgi:hypothetical protein
MANTKKKMAPDDAAKKRMAAEGDVEGHSAKNKKMAPDDINKRMAVEDDVEGHGSSIKRMGPEGANKKMGPEGGVSGSSKRSAVDDDDVEGHMIGTMNPVLARDLSRAKEQDVQRSASRGNLISEAKRAIRRKD